MVDPRIAPWARPLGRVGVPHPCRDESGRGDGTAHSNSAAPSHQYTASGTHTAKLTVSDGALTSSATLTITVGNRPPVATITLPLPGSHYDVGDTMTFSGTGTDPGDGTLPPSSWRGASC